jgi:hypothetical protein
MRKHTWAVVALLVAVVPAWGQPKLVIPAEVAATPGEWVRVIPDTTAAAVSYVGLDGLSAFPADELKDPRRLIVFAASPGRYRFVAVGSLNDEHARVSFTIVVGGTPVPPGPVPPGPTPSPDGLLGLAKVSRDGAAKVSATEKTAQAVRLAAAQKAHASAVAAGAFPAPPAILDGWRAVNNAAVPSVVWWSWGQGCGDALEALYKAGKLPDNAAWSAAFREIAAGLEK